MNGNDQSGLMVCVGGRGGVDSILYWSRALHRDAEAVASDKTDWAGSGPPNSFKGGTEAGIST